MIRDILILGTLAAFSFAPGSPALHPDEVSDLAAEIRQARDEADPESLVKLAGFKNRAAAEALVEIYESMASIFMRLEVLNTLPTFDGVGEAEQLALQKLMDIATESEDRELREAALEGLARCDHLGTNFLAMIVESAAEDDIRERAMDLHVGRSDESAHGWYAKIYEGPAKAEESGGKKKKKKKEEEEETQEPKVRSLDSLREKACRVIAPTFDDAKLEEASRDHYWGIRYLALEELQRRNQKKAVAKAEELYGDLEGRVELRILSAQIMANDEGKRIADRFLDDGRKFITPTQLRNALADILAGFNDSTVNSKVSKLVGKGKTFEKLFILRAVRKVEDPKLDKKLQQLLADKDTDVQVAAARVLAERGDQTAAPALQKMIDKSKDPLAVSAALDAMSALRGSDPEWDAQLVQYAASEKTEVRNAAIMQIGRDGRAAHFDILEAGLTSPLWSTRFAALKGLAALRDKRALPLIVAQMKNEQGRMEVEFADVLFELTGKPYRTNARSWESWWKNEGKDFEVISLKELEQAREMEQERRLKQITNVKFFGIRIISHRVIFIIDISGSMNEEMSSRYSAKGGETRIAVAKRELTRCLEALDAEALFNIIPFSSGVEVWLEDGIAGVSDKTRQDAIEYVSRLGAGGATNLYDSIRLAFDDPDVDTIFILSDGEPTAGEQVDITVIRDHVKAWNEHRRIVINTIGIGGQFQVLEWLAEDSGGTHAKFR